MISPKTLDELASRIAQALPPGVRELQRDVEKNIRAAVQSAFSRLDLVTRTEFDVQSQVLAKTRAQLAELERQVAALERELRDQGVRSTVAQNPDDTTR